MVGENIIFLRKRNGLTQEALSEKINVSRQTVAKWERGESEPDCSSLMRLSSLFDVTIDALGETWTKTRRWLESPPRESISSV